MSDVRYVKGLEDLSGAFRGVSDAMRQQLLKAAVWAAIQPIKVAAKRFAKRSEDTGALRDSITDKVVNYPHSGKAVGLVGPDSDYYLKGKKTRLGRFHRDMRRPAKYGHLIEYGHVVAVCGRVTPKYNLELVGIGQFSRRTGKERRRWKRTTIREEATGKAGGFAQPRPFLRPAVATTLQKQGEEFFQSLKKNYERELNKLKKGV